MGDIVALELAIQQLLAASGTASKLQRFLKDQMADLLDDLGRLDYQTAIDALRDAEKSNDPKREITIAMTCLRSAYKKFRKNANSSTYFSRFCDSTVSCFTIGLVRPSRLNSAEGAVECCLLIATIYASEPNQRELTKQFLQMAQESYDIYAIIYKDYLVDSAGGGGGQTMIAADNLANDEISKQKIKLTRLCQELNK